MTLADKAARLFQGGYSAEQVALRLKRSPLRHVMKSLRGLGRREEKRERRRFARALETAEAAAQAAALRRDGALRLGLLDAELTAELVAEGRRIAREREGPRRGHKDFWNDLLVPEDLRLDSIFLRYALQPRIVALVSSYLGELPYLASLLLTLSVHREAPLKVSQLWHLDYDDVRMVKFFAYLNDVTAPDDGPFSYIPPRESKRVSFLEAAHLPDERVFGRVGRGAVTPIYGESGSSFLVDTSRCVHMGSRMAPGRQRLLFTACFVTVPMLYRASAVIPRPAPDSDRRMQLLLTA